jgi:hypothetical protein
MNKFKVQPITCNYNPQYPPKKLLKTRSVLQKTKNILISGGIMLLASSCTSNLDSNSETCEPGVICNDYHTALVCNENLMEESVNCHNCEYDIIDGDMPACQPGELNCNEDQLGICQEDTYSFQYVNCSDKCNEEFGNSSVSAGCDPNNLNNPCLCTEE